ncbi:MAG: type IV pilus secretin PilQ [Candidatus Omnitrophica bacterium]|nr:type IV pilus secretin PilQ [Candidatus Omnitrophota bacterium]
MLKKALVLLSLWVLFFAPITSTTYAQVNQEETPENEMVTMNQEGNVSLDLKDADIRNVFKILAYKSDVNIVASPEVTGLVTIQLREVHWQRALDVIVKTYGYAYEKKGNIILVTTVDQLKKSREDAVLLAEQEPLVTETFSLNFGKAAEIVESVEQMKSDRGSVNIDERTNMMIVTDVPSNIDLMANVIKQLDQTTPQVLIEAKIVETTLNDSDKLGIDWLTQATFQGSKRPTTWPFSSNADDRFMSDNFPGPDSTLPSTSQANLNFTYGTLNLTQLQAVFEALKARTDTNILSAPRIVTMDNKTAHIEVGTDYPIPQYSYNEEQAQLQVNGFSWKTIGIQFEVTPHVNNAGFVTMEIIPTVSEMTGTVPFDNINLPLINKEEARTTVMVKDAETLVIAGLIRDKTTDIIKRTPLVGDIPVFGYLFRKKEKTIAKTDIIIFLTPHIVTAQLDEE